MSTIQNIDNISHNIIKELIRVFYPDVSPGVCHGFSHVWAQNIIASEKEEQSFYTLLEVISTYVVERNKQEKGLESIQLDSKKLSNDIKNLEDKVKQKGHTSLSKEEWKILDIKALCDSVMLIQSTEQFLDVFNMSSFRHGQNEIGLEFTKPFNMNKKNSNETFQRLDALYLNREGLLNYLKTVENSILRDCASDDRVSFLLSSNNHTLGLYYNVKNREWKLMDINRLSFNKKTFITANSKELATLIQESTKNILFGSKAPKLSGHQLIDVCMYSNRDNLKLKKHIIEKHHKYYDEFLVNDVINQARNLELLSSASRLNDLKNIKTLLELEPDIINMFSFQFRLTPLQLASNSGNDKVVEILLKAGADTELKCSDNKTALMYAIRNNDIETMTKLLEYGALADERSLSAFINNDKIKIKWQDILKVLDRISLINKQKLEMEPSYHCLKDLALGVKKIKSKVKPEKKTGIKTLFKSLTIHKDKMDKQVDVIYSSIKKYFDEPTYLNLNNIICESLNIQNKFSNEELQNVDNKMSKFIDKLVYDCNIIKRKHYLKDTTVDHKTDLGRWLK